MFAHIDVPHEIEIMLVLARGVVGPEAIERARELCVQGVNWDLFIEACRAHKVLPLVCQNLDLLGDDFPPHLKVNLEDGYVFENALHNQGLVEELLFILDLFESKGILTVPFKGPVLTESILGDFTLRRYLDLDLLVSADDALEAVKMFLQGGYIPEDGEIPEGRGRQFYLNRLTGVALVHPRKHISIDLHWDISGRVTRQPMILEDVRNRLEKVEVGGRLLPSLPAEELLCYLCLHGIRHRWLTLDSVCCVAELIRSRGEIDWDHAREFARGKGCYNILLLGLYLAQKIGHVNLPESLVAELMKNRLITRLGEKVVKDLFSDYQEKMVVTDKFDPLIFQVLDNVWSSLRYCLRVMCLPTKEDLRVFQLPERFSFLCYGLRPIRLFGKYLNRKNEG